MIQIGVTQVLTNEKTEFNMMVKDKIVDFNEISMNKIVDFNEISMRHGD